MICVSKNSFLAALFLCVASPCFVYGMDELPIVQISQTSFEKALSFTGSPFELQVEVSTFDLQAGIAHWVFKNESLGDTAKTFSCLARLNKESNVLINSSVFRRQLTKELGCSDEEYIKATRTPKAEKILAMQNQLFDLCKPRICITLGRYNELDLESDSKLFHSDRETNPIIAFVRQGKDLGTCVQVHQIEELCNEGADLEFTYSRENFPKCVTPFMALCLMVSYSENDKGLRQIMKFFVDKHKEGIVDIDRANPEGTTGFMESWKTTATHWVGQYFFRNSRRTLQHLDAQEDDIKLIHINRQDNAGNTALFNYYSSETLGMDDALGNFIAAGADLEIANNNGLTPLKKLEQDVQGRFGGEMKYAYNDLKAAIEQKKS